MDSQGRPDGWSTSQSSRQPVINAPPVVVWTISGLVIAHVARELMPLGLSVAIVRSFGFIPARMGDLAPGLEPSRFIWGVWSEWLSPFSHALLHGDFMHLTVNALWLLVFGTAVARRIGAVRFMVLFWLCAAAGAAAHFFVNPGSVIPLVGASGAISGMMGAAVRFMFAQAALSRLGWPGPMAVPLARLTDRRVLIFVGVWVVLNVLFGVTGLDGTGQDQLIAWDAHLGGFFAGLFAIAVLDPNRRGPEVDAWRP